MKAGQVMKPCRHCGEPVEQPAGGKTKDFCSDKHRAAFRDAAQQQAIEEVVEGLAQLEAELERFAASCRGLAMRLERFRKKR